MCTQLGKSGKRRGHAGEDDIGSGAILTAAKLDRTRRFPAQLT
jgi:hypothetical protein